MAEDPIASQIDPVHDYLSREASAGRFPGAAWRVEEEGRVLSRGSVGWATLDPERETVGEATPYDLASLTKPLVTAWLAVDLEREGKLELDAPASRYLPELRRGPYATATLVDLAAHRSGLPPWRPLYLVAGSVDEYVRAIAETAPIGSHGNTVYSDLGFVLLGAVLERAGGDSLDLLFQRRIAEPLELERTGFARTGSRAFVDAAASEAGNQFESERSGEPGRDHSWRPTIPRGEVHDGNAHGLGGVAGHAGLFGTAPDLARMCREILRPKVLPWGGHRRDLLLHPVGGRGTRTFGWVPAVESGAAKGVLPDDAPGHTGFTGTSVWLDPKLDQIFVLLTNRVHPLVPSSDFQAIRREFHRAAVGMTRGGSPSSSAFGARP